MRSHFPRTLAPLSPSTPLLPIHQCGSAAPQQPPLPSPLHCPTDHLLPKTSQSRCSPPSTTRTATAILSSEVHGDSLTSPWSPHSLICSHLQPSTSFLVILVSASAVTKCQPPEYHLVILPKATEAVLQLTIPWLSSSHRPWTMPYKGSMYSEA